MDVPAYLVALSFAVPSVMLAMALRGPFSIVWRALGRISRVRAAACLVAAAAVVGYGGGKGPVQIMPLAQVLTALANGDLLGPYAHFVASGAAETAIVESVAATTNLLSDCVAVLDAAAGDIDALEAYVLALPPALWIAADMVPPAVGAPRNLYARIEGSEPVSLDRIRYYVWFSMSPAFPPVMEFDVEYLPGVVAPMLAVTNSWPGTVSRDTPDGPVECLWYEVLVPADARSLCLRPESRVRMGRADQPMRVPTIALTVENSTYTPTNGWLSTGMGWDLRADNGIIIDWRDSL